MSKQSLREMQDGWQIFTLKDYRASGILVCVDAALINWASLMQVNDLGFIASILFVLVPSVFLLILYIQTASSNANKDS